MFVNPNNASHILHMIQANCATGDVQMLVGYVCFSWAIHTDGTLRCHVDQPVDQDADTGKRIVTSGMPSLSAAD